MDIKLKNTLSGKVETFVPINPGKVSMYHCGPTVYNYAHIGNLRSYVFADIIRRTFEYNNYDVKQVINITDFGHLTSDGDEGDDKMTKGLLREGKPLTLESMRELGQKYTEAFEDDLKKLNIEHPHHLPKASDHIGEDINLIQKLLDKGFVYQTSDGLYFDTSKKPDYGKLGNINIEKLKEGARVEANNEKKNPTDFAVWKLNPNFGWEAPWGKGFPGWHIECSAMAEKYLGETFDIHTGGIDHIPVHHNNEIAQSESANEKPLANYWLHNNFITIDSQKISKSLSNDIYLKDLEEKSINPLAYRYWLLTSHYSSLANFTWEALSGANEAYKKIIRFVGSENISETSKSPLSESITVNLFNDFNSPNAIAEIWNVMKNNDFTNQEKVSAILEADKILGLDLLNQAKKLFEVIEIPIEVQTLAKEREEARKDKDFAKSDLLRDQINSLGYDVKDTENGQTVSKI